MKQLPFLFLTWLVVPAAFSQEVQTPVRTVGDWCEYEVEGIGESKQKREIVEVAPDGGYTLKVTTAKGEELRVINSDGRIIRRGEREYTLSSSSRALYPINSKLLGRVHKYSRAHGRRSVNVEVTSTVKSVEPEKISVPAGTFETLKVEFVSDYRYDDGSYTNQWVDKVWFALDPKMKFPVKFDFIDYGSRNSAVTRAMSKCGSANSGK